MKKVLKVLTFFLNWKNHETERGHAAMEEMDEFDGYFHQDRLSGRSLGTAESLSEPFRGQIVTCWPVMTTMMKMRRVKIQE